MVWISRGAQALRTCISPAKTRSFNWSTRYQFPRSRLALDNVNGASTPRVVSFREEVAKSAGERSFADAIGRPSIKNQCLFFLGGSTLVFTWAAWRTNEDTALWTEKLSGMGNVWGNRGPNSDEMRRAQFFELRNTLTLWGAKIVQSQVLPLPVKRLFATAYTTVAQRYLDATEGRRMCFKITAINAAVWFLWKFPSLSRPMMTSFTHHPLSGLSYTMLTCMFSHKSFLHLLFNSMAMVSFGSAATHWLAKQQANSPTRLPESAAGYHFLAFFISAGLFSSLTSHIVSAYIRYPRMISQLTAARTASATSTAAAQGTKSAASEILPSLGASGAIYSSMVLTALAFPDLHIALTIPPSFPIPIQYGVGTLVLVDCIGVLKGWRFFDHYAHLGGALFGAGYFMMGGKLWDEFRIRMGASAKPA